MAYSTLGWQNGQAPAISAENLNHMDQGIADADAAATAAATIAGQASAAVDGKVSKQTTTSTTKRAYAFDNTGDINVVISADNANGGTIVQRTSAGRIVCNDPNASGQAATKNYVDTNFVPKQSGNSRVYTNNPNGEIASLEYSAAATASTIAYRTVSGNVYTATPTATGHAATKGYVDDNFFQKAVVTPSLSTYQDINGYTWQELYTAMQNAGAAQIYLNNADRWLHFGSNQADTICNQIVTFAFDEILGNKFFFVLKYVKEQSGTQTIQEIQCSITSSGVISATQN